MLPLHSEKVLHPSDFVTSVQLKPLLSKMYKVFSATVAAGDFLSTFASAVVHLYSAGCKIYPSANDCRPPKLSPCTKFKGKIRKITIIMPNLTKNNYLFL